MEGVTFCKIRVTTIKRLIILMVTACYCSFTVTVVYSTGSHFRLLGGNEHVIPSDKIKIAIQIASRCFIKMWQNSHMREDYTVKEMMQLRGIDCFQNPYVSRMETRDFAYNNEPLNDFQVLCLLELRAMLGEAILETRIKDLNEALALVKNTHLV